jgi:methionyl-tRNA formyltransferase
MAEPLQILFAGTSPFALPSLRALAADPRFNVQLVITQPDRPTGRKQELTPPRVKTEAEKLGLQIFQPEKLNDSLSLLTTDYKLQTTDFLVVVSYGQILSQAVLDVPRIAPINVHASLLPRWRGASPLQHAILAGDAETGVTIQKMAYKLDAGPILAQYQTPMDPRETAVTLHDRLAEMGAKLLIDTLAQPLKPVEQDESQATFCKELKREDGFADPAAETAEHIDRKARAFTPWPGVTLTIDGQPLKLLQTSLQPQTDAHPLPCAGGSTLYLVTVQPAGKKAMSGKAWAAGRKS